MSKVSHPLYGAGFKLLNKLVRSNGKDISFSGWFKIISFYISAIGRMPFSVAEKIKYNNTLPSDKPLSKPPIFIVGYWRSGTTHLYNIMSKGGFGYVSPIDSALPWDMLTLGRLFRPLLEKSLPESRYIDNVEVNPDSPQEDEIAIANMTDLSFFHGIYFPQKLEYYFNRGVFFDDCNEKEINKWINCLKLYLKKLEYKWGTKQLLIKNPVYTARVKMLSEIYPGAKFIHIHRNPYKVFLSMRNFFKKLLNQFALQDFANIDTDSLILNSYKRVMEAILLDTHKFDEKHFIEINYDELQRNPLATIEKIYTQLELDGFETSRAKFENYLGQIKHYQKNKYDFDNELTVKTEKYWLPYIKKLGYEVRSMKQGL